MADYLEKWCDGIFKSSAGQLRQFALEKPGVLPNGDDYDHIVLIQGYSYIEGKGMARLLSLHFERGTAGANICDYAMRAFFDGSGILQIIEETATPRDAEGIKHYSNDNFIRGHETHAILQAKYDEFKERLVPVIGQTAELVPNWHPLAKRDGELRVSVVEPDAKKKAEMQEKTTSRDIRMLDLQFKIRPFNGGWVTKPSPMETAFEIKLIEHKPTGEGLQKDVEINVRDIQVMSTALHKLAEEHGGRVGYPNPFNKTMALILPKDSPVALKLGQIASTGKMR